MREHRAEGCGEEGGQGKGREKERERRAEKMTVLERWRGWCQCHVNHCQGESSIKHKASAINQPIIRCKEKALTSSSNWLIHLVAQDRCRWCLWTTAKQPRLCLGQEERGLEGGVMDLKTAAPLLFLSTLSWARAEGLPCLLAHLPASFVEMK